MSNMAHDGASCWDSLPSVIMLEIFSYLKHKDRINASGVCKNWRQALFHPSFWKDITFIYEDSMSIPWARHLADCFALSVQNATIRCQTPHWSPELESLLRNFQDNRNLKKLIIEPTSSTFEWTTNLNDSCIWTERIYKSLLKIISTTKQLKVLTLGCNEDLSVRSRELIDTLILHHGKQLTHLGLASVKEDPENYESIHLNPIIFRQFESLVVLTLDYEHLNNILLDSLTSGTLERLVVHIHDWQYDHPGTSNESWQRFTLNNKRCGLRLNLLHAYVGVTILHSNILQPAMPLTHLRALFCESVNLRALFKLSSWYSSSLKSLVWIDSMDHDELEPPTDDYSVADSADALVLIAWRCLNLVEMVYIGHKYYQENLLAIARLRGHVLRRFEFAESNIISEDEFEFEKTKSEINEILGVNWKPFTDAELTPVLIDAVSGDSRDVIMPLVLEDAK
ncbi:F-box only protein 33 [Fopius arisanus]|uniref:F-box only protein 33 n=1 Tax=Fopius arisanus TaxID=64838 RepID=A0A0C9R9U1_9HYME|nr:PREDICTED: F-box only protein 33 [Fopius arisanus]